MPSIPRITVRATEYNVDPDGVPCMTSIPFLWTAGQSGPLSMCPSTEAEAHIESQFRGTPELTMGGLYFLYSRFLVRDSWSRTVVWDATVQSCFYRG
ncbi:hypothetical protein OIDMADRAFT_16410 [Oidiodendron maius Zn]|uniref:Uncharacterized protein n=1 Tax=Oidiodendron maius (strain Zn) TaxID=913774 RepID=A0A0C3HIC9_OIDMZ|nr:hypothetical protein OIDMADRAFT_16410 [Oidiodendron maius Zn]